jgi:DeoR/GlpR family transcriptional regulator of sugar metabolism
MADEKHSEQSQSGSENEVIKWQRRKFIRNQLLVHGRVSEEAVRDWCEASGKDYSLKALRNDLSFIESYESKTLFEVRDPKTRDLEWVDSSRSHGATRNERLGYQTEAKRQIGEIITALLLGFRKFRFDRKLDDPDHLSREHVTIACLDSIRKEIGEFIGSASTELLDKFHRFWAMSQRSLFLDAGTTTQIFAQEFLQFFRFPLSGIQPETKPEVDSGELAVNKIEVITNDRYIFNRLGDATVDIKTIMVGGRQQFRSSSTSGILAERFLEVNNIRADVAIVSATNVFIPSRQQKSQLGQKAMIYAENEHFAALKRHFLDRSNIRIIVADATKFNSYPKPLDIHICPLQCNNIDLVVTNKADTETSEYFKHTLGIPLIAYERVEAGR